MSLRKWPSGILALWVAVQAPEALLLASAHRVRAMPLCSPCAPARQRSVRSRPVPVFRQLPRLASPRPHYHNQWDGPPHWAACRAAPRQRPTFTCRRLLPGTHFAPLSTPIRFSILSCCPCSSSCCIFRHGNGRMARDRGRLECPNEGEGRPHFRKVQGKGEGWICRVQHPPSSPLLPLPTTTTGVPFRAADVSYSRGRGGRCVDAMGEVVDRVRGRGGWGGFCYLRLKGGEARGEPLGRVGGRQARGPVLQHSLAPIFFSPSSTIPTVKREQGGPRAGWRNRLIPLILSRMAFCVSYFPLARTGARGLACAFRPLQ